MLASLLLAGLVLAAYWPAGRCGFVSLDDPGYVSQQPMVRHGLRPAAMVWAATAPHGGNWHPLTTFSHLLDCSLFGVAAAPMHWENVLIHIANTLLVFAVLHALVGRVWIATLVAALFGLHPLHVESVAWISERKDVLSAFFWLLGLAVYARWARTPSGWRYAMVVFCGFLALLAKPMAVGFPVTLLLLDYWPLQRWPARSWRSLLWEKLPLIALAAAFCVITWFVQRSVGAMVITRDIGLAQRAGNALVSYATYLGKTAWPASLAVIYPHPGSHPWMAIFGAGVLIALLSAIAAWQWKRRRWILFGWLWFLLTLLPAIGIVQVGRQAMADRYTYIPLLGIFVILAMALAELSARFTRLRMPCIVAVCVALSACLFLTRRQIASWQDGTTLFERAVAVAPRHAVPRLMLADAMEDAGRPEEEILPHYRSVLEIDAANVTARQRMAKLAARAGRYDEARALLDEALRLEQNNFVTHHALGILSAWQQRPAEAAIHLRDALRLKPGDDSTHRELARIFYRSGRMRDAQTELEAAIRGDWWNAVNHEKLGLVLEKQGRGEASRASFERALWIDPDCPEAREGLARLRSAASEEGR